MGNVSMHIAPGCGSAFNYGFNVTSTHLSPPSFGIEELEQVGMGWLGEGSSEQPGYSILLRDGDAMFHTDSMYARGTEMLGGSYYSSTSPRSGARRIGRNRRDE
jgi:predicted dithiol-disulfide oxidoreductase (DUF899 family)